MADSAPLKIGIVCYPLVGGSGILATALGSELAQRGHEVHFISYAKPVRLDLAAPRIHFHEVVVNQYSLFKYPDYTLPLAVKMADVARAHALDIFHVHYAVPHATAAYLADQMIGKNAPAIVTTLHGTDTTLLGKDPSYRAAIEHALLHSDAITAVSESLRAETQATFRLNREVEVVHNFFSPSPPTRARDAVRRELGVAPDEFLVVHMSNLRAGKRVDLLLRAVAAARCRARMRLLILAGGDGFEQHAPLLDELGLRDRVILQGEVNDVEDYLNAADAGLYTSETESFGLSILETLFYGKPVIAFRVGGIPEVVTDSEHGFLHAFGDTAAMARSLDALADSPDLARKLGAEGRQHVARRFSTDEIVPRYEAIYRRCCLRPPATGSR